MPEPAGWEDSEATEDFQQDGASEGADGEKGDASLLRRMLEKRKSLKSILEEAMHDRDAGDAKLTLLDLLCIGVGSTIGSGVFVLTGKALPQAGPSAVLAWLLAGLICLLSSSSYMELSARLPTKGSCYVFSYHGLGELAGVVGAVCITMEYGISGAGVARNWSAKLSHLTNTRLLACYNGAGWGEHCNYDNDFYFDPVAAAITALCTAVIMMGLDMGKVVINGFTFCKLLLVAFLIVGGLSCWSGNPFESASTFFPGGAGGTLSATSSLFFGFIGFDEVCCMASKAKDPAKTMPRALAGTLLGAALFSGLAQFALSAMVPWQAGMSGVPFELAFEQHGWFRARWLVSVGELVLLPLVVLLSILPQPEVTAAMSEDGLLPSVFRRQSRTGVYFQGTLIVGVTLMVVAFAVPFAVLWDVISIGVLFSFNLTNAALIQVRYGNGGRVEEPQVDLLTWLLLVCTAVAGYSLQQGVVDPTLKGMQLAGARRLAANATAGQSATEPEATPQVSAAAAVVGGAALVAAAGITLYIHLGFRQRCGAEDEKGAKVFRAVGVPYAQGIAMLCNFFLMAALPWSSHGAFCVFLFVLFMLYFGYVANKSHKNKSDKDSRDD